MKKKRFLNLIFAGLGRSSDDRYGGENLYLNSLLKLIDKNRDGDLSQFLHQSSQTTNQLPKSALFYYLSASAMLQDDDLDDLISYLLREKCCKNVNGQLDDGECMDGVLDKRNNIKKVKFHSWGGKRSGSAGSSESGGRISNADLGKDNGQAKVVIRTPFRPWGGKRQTPHDQPNTFFDVIRWIDVVFNDCAETSIDT